MESVKVYYATENFNNFDKFNPNIVITIEKTHKKLPIEFECGKNCNDFNKIINHYSWIDDETDCPNDMIDFIRKNNIDHCLMKKGDIIEVKGKFWILEDNDKWINVTTFIGFNRKGE